MTDIQGPDGAIYRFPDDMSESAIKTVMIKQFGPPDRQAPAVDPDRTKRDLPHLKPLEQMIIGAASGKLPGEQSAIPAGSIETQPDVQREVNIAKRMARQRPDYNAGSVFKNNFMFGLDPDVAGLAGGIASLTSGEGYSKGYDEASTARRRLADEYAAKNPVTSALAGAGGMLTGGMPAAGMAAPAGLLGAMGQGALHAGTQGAIQGAAEGEGLEGKAIGALTGGALGLGLGAGFPVVAKGVGAVTKPLVNTYRAATDTAGEAARRIQEATAKDAALGKGMSGAEMRAAQDNGLPLTVMDTGGENMGALARSAANQSAEARQAIENVTKPRFATQTERIDEAFRAESPMMRNRVPGQAAAPVSPDAYMEAADVLARKANSPKYKAAYALGDRDVWDQPLERLAASPAMQKALQGAVAKHGDNAILEGFGAMNPRVNVDDTGKLVFSKGGIPTYPDLQLWDLTKRELDRMGKMAARNSDSDARIYQGLAKQLTEHLDSLGQMGAAYKEARNTAAGFFGAKNAFEAGQNFATQKGVDARQAVRALVKLKPEERKLFNEGYIMAQRDKLSGLKNNRDATLAFMNSPAEIAQARIALGRAGADRLQGHLAVEGTIDAMRKAMGNSTTTRQLNELALAGAAGTATGIGGGDSMDIGIASIAAAAGKHGQRMISEKLSKQIAQMLVSNDPKKIQLLVGMASKSPVYRDALTALRKSAMSTIGREATTAISDAGSHP